MTQLHLSIVDIPKVLSPDRVVALVKLVAAIADGLHEWSHPDPLGAEAIPLKYWAQPFEEILAKSYVNAVAYSSVARSVEISMTDPDDAPGRGRHRLSVLSAARHLCEGLAVYVENQLADGQFVRAALRAIGVDESLLEPADPRIQFRQGGGKSELVRLAETDGGQSTEAPFRVIFVADSDARFPGHAGDTTNELRAACASAGIPLFLWPKRMIENYFSNAQIQRYASAYPDKKHDVDAICSLSPQQRDHYPLKSGLDVGVLPIGPEQALYAGCSSDFVGAKPQIKRFFDYWYSQDRAIDMADLQDRLAVRDVEELWAMIEGEL